MIRLEKISISNARRFSENVEIDIGEGATIILAPNGTGKTTIFEAIELALTGKIKRIENSPDAIIRNGLSAMRVRLDFSQGKYCQVNYTRGGFYDKKGNYEELFGAEDNISLPFLFRLTHFLEQHDKEWLVEQDGKGAGSLLSYLPIGRDLQRIISKKTSFLRAIGKAEDSAEYDLNEAKNKLSTFEELIAKRNRLATETTLVPLEEIVAKLQPISKLFNYDDYDDEYNVTQINTYFEKIRVSLKQENSIKKDLVVRLNALKERVQLYVSNVELLNRKQIVIPEYNKKITTLTTIVVQAKKEIQDANGVLSDIKNEIKKLYSIKSMFEQVKQKREHLAICKTELDKNEKALDELRKSYGATIEFLKKSERLRDQHKIIDEEIEKGKNHQTQIQFKRDVQKQWQNLSNINREIEKNISEIEQKKNECLESKRHFDNEVSEAEKVYSVKNAALESLNKASNAIQEAVGNIRKHLAKNQRHCPVCQTDYEPDELIKRIEVSLNTLNPAIPLAITEEKNALAALEVAKEKRGKENQKLLDIDSKLISEHNKLESNIRKILDSFLPQFPGLKTPQEAYTYIEEQYIQIASQISKLEAGRSQLEPEVAIEEINNSYLQKSEDERIINELTTENAKLRNEITIETADIDRIEQSLSGEEEKAVLENISTKSIQVEKNIDFIQKLDATLSKNEAELKECQDSFLSENEAISKIKGSQEGICTEWQQAGLEGQPNEEKLKIKYEAVSKTIAELEKANASLNTIEQELVNWRIAEKFQDAENEVKKQIGDYSEKAYLELLKTSVSQRNSTLLNIQEKKEASSLFLSKVESQTQHIHEQLTSINDPWKKLLKRIIINPLISDAPLLSNSTSKTY